MANQKPQWIKKVPPRIGWYLAGFADGEGSFNVSLRRRPDHTMGWQIVLCFNLSQRDPTNLLLLKKYLGCGRLFVRKDGVHQYIVQNPTMIKEKVILFFQRFRFLSSKMKRNFMLFRKIVAITDQHGHLNREGLLQILEIREELNFGKGRKRKYSINDYQGYLRENPQRLNAKPR